jgi:flavin reductase (DIM6/NTAB) family NADH-FMN oxidoreductase RutF
VGDKSRFENRDALRMLAPGPISLVSSMYRDHANLMTAGWALSLSLDPTLIGIAIQPSRLTHEFISKSDQFAVNIPTIDLISAVHLCGLQSGREGDKFAAAKLNEEEATEIEAPLVAECVGHIECELFDRVTFGDHDLFIGQVLAVIADDEAFSGIWNVQDDAGQLLHHLGADRYAGLAKAYRATLTEDE